MNLNKVLIAGRLTADPELRTTSSGDSVVSFSVATNRFWRSKEGERKESTEFHNVVAWGRQAEIVSQFCKKGGIIMIEGRLQTRSWEGKDGQTRKTTEIVADNIQLGPRGSQSGNFKREDKEPSGEASDAPAGEDVPTIDVDAPEGDKNEEIKAEDLPF